MMVWRSFKIFSLPYPIINSYLLLWNYLLILKMLTETLLRIMKMLTETLLRIILSVIGRCSLVSASHCLQGKCARINLSQAASGMILQNHKRLPVSIFSVKIVALGSLKGVTERIFKLSKQFQNSRLKL